MELTAFNARLGDSQGRLDDGGDFVFVLGDAEPGRLHDLADGDHVIVEQPLDVTDVDFVRAHMTLSVPASTPAGYIWQAAITVDGVVMASALCTPGQVRTLTDLAANVSKRSGVVSAGVRLTLRSA